MADPPSTNRAFLLPDCLQAGASVFPDFEFELKHQLFLGLETAGLQFGTIPSALLGLQLADSIDDS